MEIPFRIKLADRIIDIHPVYDCAREFCHAYIVDNNSEKADLDVFVEASDIAAERSRDIQVRSSDGTIPDDYPDSYLELLAIYRKIAEYMLDNDTLLIHGSVIAFDGEGVLFIADSGVGKSTHSANWKKVFGDRVVLVNDDKPLVRIGDEVRIYGTPWSGKRGLNTNMSVPLKLIYQLDRGEVSRVSDMSEKDILKILIRQSFRSDDGSRMPLTLSMLDKLMKKVPVKRLECTIDPSSANTARQGLYEVEEWQR